MGSSGRVSVQQHPERYRVSRPRSKHEVDVSSVEAERNPSAGLVEDARPPLDGPVAGERPGV